MSVLGIDNGMFEVERVRAACRVPVPCWPHLMPLPLPPARFVSLVRVLRTRRKGSGSRTRCVHALQVKATGGDTHLGGEDFDSALMVGAF